MPEGRTQPLRAECDRMHNWCSKLLLPPTGGAHFPVFSLGGFAGGFHQEA